MCQLYYKHNIQNQNIKVLLSKKMYFNRRLKLFNIIKKIIRFGKLFQRRKRSG